MDVLPARRTSQWRGFALGCTQCIQVIRWDIILIHIYDGDFSDS